MQTRAHLLVLRQVDREGTRLVLEVPKHQTQNAGYRLGRVARHSDLHFADG